MSIYVVLMTYYELILAYYYFKLWSANFKGNLAELLDESVNLLLFTLN